jgi:muramoyltetrapeptide carboxypeptidase
VQPTSSALAPERFDGAILFWEEVFTSTSVVWNDLHVLRQAGALDRITGMIVGKPFEVEPTPPGPDTLRDIVLEVVGERDIPVLGDVDIGHAGPNLPMPLGGDHGLVDAPGIELSLGHQLGCSTGGSRSTGPTSATITVAVTTSDVGLVAAVPADLAAGTQ